MLDKLEKIWKEFKKNLQKTKARTAGITLLQKKEKIVETVKEAGEAEGQLAKESITSAATGLQEAVKGQFGDKVTQAFEDQSKSLEQF